MDMWERIQPFIVASICILVSALVVDIVELAYVVWCLFMPMCLHLYTSCVFADFTVFCTCGHPEMEHGRSATDLSSEERVWARPAVQYLESVFIRGTTTANSITASWVMFICFPLYWSNFQSRSSFVLQNKELSVKTNIHTTPWWELHQPTLVVAERACSGFHHKDVTLKRTTTIIIRPYFPDEFV